MTNPTTTGLTFVDELPASPIHGRALETAARAQALKDDPTHRWARWPTKAGPAAVSKALAKYGEGYQAVAVRIEGVAVTFARWTPPEETGATGPPAPPRSPQEPRRPSPAPARAEREQRKR